MRTSSQAVNPALKKQIKQILLQVLADLKDERELNIFLQDFFTESEYTAFAKRLAIAYWLKKGRSYENVRKNLKVSSATIASVQSTLEKPGIKLALKKIEAEEWASQWAEKIKKLTKK